MHKTQTAAMVAVLMMLVAGLAQPADALEAKLASQTVTVFGNLSTECFPSADSKLINQEQNSDGTTSTFVVPDKHVFVVTSFDFVFDGGTASRITKATLAVIDATVSHLSLVSIGTTLADSFGSGGGTVVLPSGFPVKTGTRLCFAFGPTATGGGVFVHGFIAPDH